MSDKSDESSKSDKSDKRMYIVYDGRAVPGIENSTDNASILECAGQYASDEKATSTVSSDYEGYDWHLYSYAVDEKNNLVDEQYVTSAQVYLTLATSNNKSLAKRRKK